MELEQHFSELDREATINFVHNFVARWDFYPLQKRNGRYSSVKQALTPELAAAHLYGKLIMRQKMDG